MFRLVIAALCCCCLLTGCAPTVDTSDALWKTERYGASWEGAHVDALVHANVWIDQAVGDADVPALVGGWETYVPTTDPTPQGLIRIASPHGQYWVYYRVSDDGFLSNSATRRRQ